jgi:S-adenosylmethionine synthetase
MFTADFYIDGVQNAKKQFVETFVTNESFKKELVNLVDSQTKFAKGQVKTSLDIAQALYRNMSSAAYSKKAA